MMTTGVDIIKIDRIKKILETRRESFYNRIFTQGEIDYIKGKNHNSKTVAALFAAKEAVSKAIGTGIGKIGWKDIEVYHSRRGKPQIRLSPKAWGLLGDIKINKFDISISHEEDYAIAFVIGYFSEN